MTTEEHKTRHAELHEALDELVAEWTSVTKGLPSRASILDLVKWSCIQTENPNSVEVVGSEDSHSPADLVARLREHADRVAGDGPSGSHYDPETLALEHEAADMIERLRKTLAKGGCHET